ncbi:MAG: KR domain-containing protein [Oscillospiraceae bacterium]|nr:KR domain-containing protein [Oscillospiraceae bacterium]
MGQFYELFQVDFSSEGSSDEDAIAIIGLSAMAGHAQNAQELWEALCRGDHFVRPFPEGRKEDADAFVRYLGLEPYEYAEQSYLDRIDEFSPSFFHIPPKDAALLDPAQRLFLMTAWRALQDGGFTKEKLSGSDTGVYVGYTTSEHQYSTILSKSNPEYGDRALSGTVNSIIASRLSYFLNLRGPAVMVDTACSSSLVAVHLACNAIRSGECSMAVAGGVKYTLIPERAGDSGELTVNSRDGHTRTFDKDSDGTNGGEGVAAVILKPLSMARRDGDRVYAVIKGSAINQDGASVGITAPNAAAQEAVILKAWEAAGIDPEHISYIEAHGTATKLGDPVEISGIREAFGKYTDRKQFCAIGSLKTNMGHLDSAAGIMGLVKCVLALWHKMLPPHLHFTAPNARINFMDSPLYINDRLQDWQSEYPRTCGVSSFGMSGTNCHVVLQEYCEDYAHSDMRANAGPSALTMQEPLKTERCWENPVAPTRLGGKKQGEALLDVCLADSPGIHLYGTLMSEETHSEVREHIIGERNVLAGTVYVEMIRSAASKMLHTQQLQIDSLVFMTPMIFEKGQTREVQTVLYAKAENEVEASVQSKVVGEEEWTVHVHSKVSTFSEDRPTPVDVPSLLSRMGENDMDRTETSVDQMVTTGPRWKVQKGIWIGDGEAVTVASADEEFAGELSGYGLYPSMLDAAVNCSSVLNGNVFCLPYYYGSMRIYGPMTGTIYSHSLKNMESSSSDGEIHVFDIEIFDESGQIIATVKDYAMKKTNAHQRSQFFQYKEPLLRQSTWIQEKTQYRSSRLYSPDQTILLVSCIDRYPKALYRETKAALKDRVHELVFCDWAVRNTEGKTYIFPDSPKAFREFFQEMEYRNLNRILFFVPEDRAYENGEDFRSEMESVTQGFFQMIAAVASNKALGNVSIDILIPYRDEPTPLSMLIAGMGKSALYEYSRLEFRCILISSDTGSEAVFNEISYNHSNYMVMLREGQRWIPHIQEPEAPEETTFALAKGGTYLITGGTGGIGLVMAELLSELESDIHLILLSRRELLPQEQWNASGSAKYEKLLRIKERVSSLECVSCDVSDSKALRAFMDSHPGIRGIIHAAGLPGGGFVIKREWKDFLQVLGPKVFGTREIVSYAETQNMDFLLLFSSYSTVLPVAGQADYIGANSFMDAYESYHNASGRIKVINWSGWKECGMALDNGVDMERSPVRFLTNGEGKAALLQAMQSRSNRVLIGEFQYNELASGIESFRKVLHFDEGTMSRIRSAGSNPSVQNENYTITVRGKDTPLTPTEEKVSQAWAKTLGLREVHYQDRFLEIGGDSLSATYLQKEIEKSFPGTMDITDVFVYPTIEQMSEYIDSKLGTSPVQEPSEIVEAPITEAPEVSEPEDKLSDADQMRKLLELLASGEIDVGQAGQLL